MIRDSAFAEAHNEVAQGLSGAWWQANAALSAAEQHASCPDEIKNALETLCFELLRLLREAQDVAVSFDAERAGRLHIVSALEEQLHAFREATGARCLTLRVSGDPVSHSADSLSRLYAAFKLELDRLAGRPGLPVGVLEVDFDAVEPGFQFSPAGTQPMF